jgi:hypothetical protein
MFAASYACCVTGVKHGVQLKRVGRVKAVVPLFFAKSTVSLGALPSHINAQVNDKCIRMLERFDVPLTQEDRSRIQQRTIKDIGAAMQL